MITDIIKEVVYDIKRKSEDTSIDYDKYINEIDLIEENNTENSESSSVVKYDNQNK